MRRDFNFGFFLWRPFAIASIAILGSVPSASADWYSGDPYTAPTAWPQYSDYLSDASQVVAMTFDNFTWVPGSGGGVVDRVGGHFTPLSSIHNGSAYDTGYWEIRTGMSHNVAGTLVASGSGPATWSATSFTQGPWTVWRSDVDVPDFMLPAGNYWFGLAVGVSTGNQQGAFVASTTGANGIGGPLGDDLSIYYQLVGSTVSWDYTESAIINPGLTGFDPSYYINEVPEPGTIALVGLAALLGILRRRR